MVEDARAAAQQGDLAKAEANLAVGQAYRGIELKYILFDDKPGLKDHAKAIDDVTRYYYHHVYAGQP